MVLCLKRFLFAFGFLIVLTIITSNANTIYAATLSNSSDTLTTSRPSASTPLGADVAASAATATVINNGSTFLASDSAHFWGQTQESVTIATVSADKLTLFFTGTTANAHAKGTAISTAITAMHTVKFTTSTTIPSTGSFLLTFPPSISTDTNQASPSASTFMPNGLASANIKASNANLTCSLVAFSAGASPIVKCNNSTSAITGGTSLTVLIGCSSNTGATCNTQVPTLINPTKIAQAGTADTWNLAIATYDSANGTGNQLDTANVKIGTQESVNVVAHIDPTFTFTISGVPNAFAISGVCTSNTDTTNTGFPTTSTDVNLGTLISTTTNVAAQKMVITSNAGSGYSITATSSGFLINSANGQFIANAQGVPTANDAPVPATIANGGNQFGIHPCDNAGKVVTGTWGTSPSKYANPSSSFYYTLVNSGTAPASSGDTFYVEYAASPASTTPPGDYHTVETYVATVVF